MSKTTKSDDPVQLKELFRKIERRHSAKVRERSAKLVLGPSVIRALKKGIKEKLRTELQKLKIRKLVHWAKSEENFKKKFEAKCNRIKQIIGSNKKIKKGKQKGNQHVNKHAHAPKILALYCRELLTSSWEAVGCKAYKKVEMRLFCPVDKIVIEKIRKCEGGPELLGDVKSMGTMEKDTFMNIQKWLAAGAKGTGIPIVWFDDAWIEDVDR